MTQIVFEINEEKMNCSISAAFKFYKLKFTPSLHYIHLLGGGLGRGFLPAPPARTSRSSVCRKVSQGRQVAIMAQDPTLQSSGAGSSREGKCPKPPPPAWRAALALG